MSVGLLKEQKLGSAVETGSREAEIERAMAKPANWTYRRIWGHATETLRDFVSESRGPRGTPVLTPEPLFTRESESFGPFFRGPRGTLRVPFSPRGWACEIERIVFSPKSS